MPEDDVIGLIQDAFHRDDAPRVRELLGRSPGLRARINEPVGPFDSPAVVNVRSRAMLDVLLAAGADINARSRWWAGGFGILESASPELARYAIERGARVDAHSAARLGMMEKLRELVDVDPALVHARGGDGQTPLHFASTVEIAGFLLDRGADIDARDIDHESTAAQWMVKSRQGVARFLVSRGCTTDLLMAAALGDIDLVRRHLAADPGAVRLGVSDEYFPMIGLASSAQAGKETGGTIYQWELGWYVSAHQVAKEFGHEEVFRLLMERSPAEVKLIAACWLGDEALIASLLAAEPGLVGRLGKEDRRQIAHAARNNDLRAVRAMVEIGVPQNGVSQHAATALHWAAFNGNAEMVRLLLRGKPALEVKDRDHDGTPLSWAIHGSEHGWEKEKGDYAGVVAALLRAGAKRPKKVGGSAAVREVLARG